jgi:hypothetical protein
MLAIAWMYCEQGLRTLAEKGCKKLPVVNVPMKLFSF